MIYANSWLQSFSKRCIVGLFNRNTPDPAQESQGDGYSKTMIQALSAVCVRSPHYGTRSVSPTHAKSLSSISPCLCPPEVPDRAVLACRIIQNRELLVHKHPQCNQPSTVRKWKGIVCTVMPRWISGYRDLPVAQRSEGQSLPGPPKCPWARHSLPLPAHTGVKCENVTFKWE